MPSERVAAAEAAAVALADNLAPRRPSLARLTPVSLEHRSISSMQLLTCMTSEIDNATDKIGMGDKYDDKINKFADGQINNQIPGGAGNSQGGSGGGLGGLGK